MTRVSRSRRCCGDLGHGVVEDLAHVEGLRQCRLRVRHGGGERRGVLLAELLDGQGQFVVAGAHGVVDVDDDRLRQVVERVERQRCQRVGVGRVDPTCGGELGLAALARTPARHSSERQQRERDDGEEDQRPRPTGRGRVELPSASARWRRRSRRPPSRRGAGTGSTSLRRSRLESTSPQDGVGHQQRVVPVLGGDGEDGVLVGLKVVDAHGVSAPTRRRVWPEKVST